MTRLTYFARSAHPVRMLICSMLIAAAGGLLSHAASQAAIIAINTPGTSNASITFDDTNSVAPPAGTTNSGPSVTPWNGTVVTLPVTTDPNTGDFANGSIDATFIPASNTYALNFNSITLNQAVGNTGFANLDFAFNVEYQLDALGLPSQPTLFPNFVVNGTVQNTALSFAAVTGFINYEGVNTAGTISVLDTVNYNSVWNTPGPFSGVAVGIPTFGFTPVLVGNTTLTLSGVIQFQVDPALINAQSVQSFQSAVIPEPSSAVLLGIGACVTVMGAFRRHRAKRIAVTT